MNLLAPRVALAASLLGSLGLAQSAGFPYFQGCESGSLDGNWTVSSPWGDGRSQVTTAGGALSGERHLVFDTGTDGQDSNAVADLRVDLSKASSVLLEFGVRGYTDDYETVSGGWLGPDPAHYDGVFVSDDGGLTWTLALALDEAAAIDEYQRHVVDLDAVIAGADLSYSTGFVVRFSWHGDRSHPGDGLAIDDVGLRALEYADLGSLTSLAPETAGDFGRALASVRDVDGDGVRDLAVGHPGHDAGRGRVELYSGKSLASLFQTPVGTPGAGLGDVLVTLGDMNGNGYDELLIGSPKSSQKGPGSGSAFVFDSKTGLKTKTLLGQAAGEALGTSLAAVPDLDGDGLPEIVVGIPGASGTAGVAVGVVRVFGSSDFSLLLEAEGLESGERLGSSVDVWGDLDGDGKPDLVAGSTAYELPGTPGVAVGVARVFSTGTGALLQTFVGEGGGFGASVCGVGDLDGDLVADWAVGAPDQDGGRGMVWFFSGADGGTLQEERGATPGIRLGAMLQRVGDLDGDGDVDLAIGSDAAAGGLLRARELPGLATLLSIDAAAESAGFGSAVADLGDLDGDGIDDLAVAAPGEGQAFAPDAGRVHLAGTAEVPRVHSVEGMHCALGGDVTLLGANLVPGMVVRIDGQAVPYQLISPVQATLTLSPDIPGGFRDVTVWSEQGSQTQGRALPRFPAIHVPAEAPLGAMVTVRLDNGEPGSFVLAFSGQRYSDPAPFSAWGWYHGLELNGVWIAGLGNFTALETSRELFLPAPMAPNLVGTPFHLQAWTSQSQAGQMGFTDTVTVTITD